MREYHKIFGPFMRHVDGPDRGKVILNEWTKPEFKFLQHNIWRWTEKVDGTNIRVHWDGHKVTFGGRTDKAMIPAKLLEQLNFLFYEELFEQNFEDTEVTLYGEGFGAGIQSGGKYAQEQNFVLFDVRIGNWWLTRESVEEIATNLGCNIVPVRALGTVWSAISLVADGLGSSWGDFDAEGLVGTPGVPLFARDGSRIIMKVKANDFKGIEL